MAIIVCGCGEPGCKMKMALSMDGVERVPLWFTDKEGNEFLMYLDANGVTALLRALRSCLEKMTEAS